MPDAATGTRFLVLHEGHSVISAMRQHIPPGVRLHTRGGTCMVRGMEFSADTVNDVTKRLRRVEGQVRGIQQMLAEGRDCRDVVTQISAANKALEQAGFVLVAAGLTWCLEDPERSRAEGYDISDVQKMFTKLA